MLTGVGGKTVRLSRYGRDLQCFALRQWCSGRSDSGMRASSPTLSLTFSTGASALGAGGVKVSWATFLRLNEEEGVC